MPNASQTVLIISFKNFFNFIPKEILFLALAFFMPLTTFSFSAPIILARTSLTNASLSGFKLEYSLSLATSFQICLPLSSD